MNKSMTWTYNSQFDKDGYLYIPNIWDPRELYRSVPDIRGQINYWGKKEDQYNYTEEELQVIGSLATYYYPGYRYIHNEIRLKLEEIIGRRLYNTYYYDRFYFAGQSLEEHIDRDACEISISVHISSNCNNDWPLWIETPSGEERSVLLNCGDGMLYKGCERKHWRNPLISRYNRKKENDDTYYHQVFFHYVLQDGHRAHCAWDRAR
jgi:hypothetical protein